MRTLGDEGQRLWCYLFLRFALLQTDGLICSATRP
jgi:hypothetical protein